MKKTEWFHELLKPVHIGVYETLFMGASVGYSHWNGKRWGNQSPTPEDALKRGTLGIQQKIWRGLTEPQS